MNIPIAAVFGLTLLAFVAHITGGMKESLSTDPKLFRGDGVADEAQERIGRNWTQLMCAFQLVSVDLLALAVVLYFLAFTEVLAPARSIALGVVCLYLLWGCSWLLQLYALKRKPKDYLFLGHWAFWFLCAGLVAWGRSSL